MKSLFGLILGAIYLLHFSSQSEIATQWSVKQNELMLLDKEGVKPELFDSCPKDNKKCQKCKPFSDYNVNETFKKILLKSNKNKFYCFYEAIDNDDKKKINRAQKYDKEYKDKKDLLFDSEDICNAYCINSVEKRCGKVSKSKVKLLFIKIKYNNKFYCPKKSD